ncbi:cytosolic Fe-S cluster assembly factor NUBP2 homolog [Littorina saxatilis]|uniref:Cytosolic Fe-S cluster assembly factor NUBP2 homolog n=2 Tax=Littorina saxatilis TaxID=31220 RepID=A0AAN9GIY6_9CAEN
MFILTSLVFNDGVKKSSYSTCVNNIVSNILQSSTLVPTPVGMERLKSVQHVIVVLSGKGGVGKSTVAVQLALALRAKGKKVGLLDVDLCGPSIPKMFNLEGQSIHQCSEGWLPVYVDPEQKLGVMSIAFLLENEEEAVIWRGPKKTAMIRQFLSDVHWQDTEYLIIDTPPGTSDEHISVMENLRAFNPDGAILVTTPQAVAVGDVRRELTFCRKTGIPVIGIIENMSGYMCPHCSECTNIFSSGGGEALAKEAGVQFLGCVPVTKELAAGVSAGQSATQLPSVPAIEKVADRLIALDKDLP